MTTCRTDCQSARYDLTDYVRFSLAVIVLFGLVYSSASTYIFTTQIGPCMALRSETMKFLDELERFSDRALHYRDEVGLLIEVAETKGKKGAFNEAIFLAKFITKSIGVMQRIGIDGEGYDKLSAEFQSNTQKASAILKDILEVAPAEARTSMAPFFPSLTQESLEHFVRLLSDLAIVKNWVLDGKQLPGGPAA